MMYKNIYITWMDGWVHGWMLMTSSFFNLAILNQFIVQSCQFSISSWFSQAKCSVSSLFQLCNFQLVNCLDNQIFSSLFLDINFQSDHCLAMQFSVHSLLRQAVYCFSHAVFSPFIAYTGSLLFQQCSFQSVHCLDRQFIILAMQFSFSSLFSHQFSVNLLLSKAVFSQFIILVMQFSITSLLSYENVHFNVLELDINFQSLQTTFAHAVIF